MQCGKEEMEVDFIQLYQDKRDEGYNELEALGIVANTIAIRGTKADLIEVCDYHIDEFLEKF